MADNIDKEIKKKQWIENDELFIKELKKGYGFQIYVALQFLLEGLWVRVPPLSIRDSREEIPQYTRNEADLFVWGSGNGKQKKISVKSRNIEFYTIDTYPYKTIFIDTVRGWEAKEEKPCAVIIISQQTKEIIVVPVSSREHWTIEERSDQTRNIAAEEFYAVSKEYAKTFSELVEWIKGKK
ncbi:MAG: hypothetical protein ACYTBZ_29115 [Planctomycetota bacterium]|jgi:hypothetical protein